MPSKGIELVVQRHKNDIRQLADLAQRVILRNPLLQRHTTEHLVLNPFFTTHTAETDDKTRKS